MTAHQPFPIPCNSPYHGQVADRWTSPNDVSSHDTPWLTVTGIRQLADANYTELSQITSEQQPISLVVLGEPATMLCGAASMLRSCLNSLNVKNLVFVHSYWSSAGFLSNWWRHWLSEPLPATCQISTLNTVSSGSRLIGLDLNLLSPSKEAALMLSRGFPIVSLPTTSVSSRGCSALLSSLGLDVLAPVNPDIWLNTVQTLVDEFSAYNEISLHIENCFSASLVFDFSLFARDLAELITILQSTKDIDS